MPMRVKFNHICRPGNVNWRKNSKPKILQIRRFDGTLALITLEPVKIEGCNKFLVREGIMATRSAINVNDLGSLQRSKIKGPRTQ